MASLSCLALFAAADAAAEDVSGKVEKCGRKLGSIAVVEPQYLIQQLGRYSLGSPAQLLRLMIQESGCFDVVERGVAMQNLQQERALADAGQLRGGSNVGEGQMQVADFVLTPAVQFSESNTGGISGALFNRLGPLGAVLGGLRFKEAETSIVLSDVRSSIQVASAQGQASKTDFGIGGWAWLGGGVGAAGGFTRTPEGRVIAASLLDNYNKIVTDIRDRPQLIATKSAASDANARASTQAGTPIEPGQMLSPRLEGIRVFASPSADSNVIATLRSGEQVIATGETEGAFAKVDGVQFASGWVQRSLVAPARAAASPAVATGAAMPPPPPPQTPPAVSVAGLSTAAEYRGTFSGDDSGTFQMRYFDGTLEGTIDAKDAGVMYITGQVDKDGNFSFQGESRTRSYLMRGRAESGTNHVTGTWRTVDGTPRQGVFVADRTR
jgi:curli biogenesis system outer membrane secretion channel CsgG